MATITKDMTILEVLQNHPQAVEVLQSLNLGCLGCIAASGESLEQGLSAHGLNVNDVVEKLNQAVTE